MSAISSAAEPETVGLSSDGLACVDRYLAELIDAKVLPGAVTLVARHGKVIHRSVYGYKDLSSGAPLSQETIFRIYSMTKPVTAVAMMILHDRGVWSPDDPIAKHLPEFAGVKGPDGKAPDHAPTMRELMTHTAGFGYGIGPGPHDATDKAYIEAGVWQADDLADMTRRIASIPLAYQPGTRWRYSLSMDLQGAVIERLSGQRLPDFMRSNIFQPLGMADTDFFVPADKLSRLATVYHMYGVDELTVLDHPGFVRDPRAIPKLTSGGGGLFSTVDDYARFAQMLLNKGELDGVRIVSTAAVALMTSNHLSNALLNGGFFAGVHRMRPGYGYGFNGAVFHDPEAAGSPVGQGTYQWDGAAGTWFWIDPEHDLLYIGLIQRMLQEGMPPLQEKTQALIAEAMRPLTAPIIRLARPDDVAALAELAEKTFYETFVEGFAVGYPAEDLAAFLRDSYALDKVAAWIADPKAQVLVAEHDGRLIAYAQAGDNDLPHAEAKPGDGELKRIYVSRAAQGTGLGRLLLERSLDWLGARPVYIGVWSENLKAQRLYAHYGFEKVGEYKFMVGLFADPEFILRRG